MQQTLSRYPVQIKDFRKEDTTKMIRDGCEQLTLICKSRFDRLCTLQKYSIIMFILYIPICVFFFKGAKDVLDWFFVVCSGLLIIEMICKIAFFHTTKRLILCMNADFENAVENDINALRDFDFAFFNAVCQLDDKDEDTLSEIIHKVEELGLTNIMDKQILAVSYQNDDAIFIYLDEDNTIQICSCSAALSREDRSDIQLSILDFGSILRVPNTMTDEELHTSSFPLPDGFHLEKVESETGESVWKVIS